MAGDGEGRTAGRGRGVTTERGLDRVVNFSDAVVAIAITLIILPLVDLAQEHDDGSVVAFFGHNWTGLAAAALSFVVIANFWRDHHRLFERTVGYSTRLVTLNFVWLAGIVFLPLPTVLLFDGTGDDRGAPTLYIATMLVSMVAVRLQQVVVERDGLLSEDAAAAARRPWPLVWFPTGLMLLAGVLAATVPGLGAQALYLLLLSIPIGWIGGRRHRVAPSTSSGTKEPSGP
ncbi:TMEM175 family protein [Plantibacter auratus]|uniref:TMEM175 family protein n=1 Tax=Plantibacter auratus TaxID=272914 RepID=UPI003D334784